MTINPSFAAFTAVSSAVLMFGNTAHAEELVFLGYPPSPTSMAQVYLPPSDAKTPVEIPAYEAPPDTIASEHAKELDELPKIEALTTEANISAPVTTPPSTTSRPYYGSSAGNTYAWGYCTWHVKNKRPDLPNGLGNGGQWVANAAKRGLATGTVPRAGAVGEQPGHVVYIESVNANGTVNISEMNYNGGFGIVNKRTVPASTFKYIY